MTVIWENDLHQGSIAVKHSMRQTKAINLPWGVQTSQLITLMFGLSTELISEGKLATVKRFKCFGSGKWLTLKMSLNGDQLTLSYQLCW